MAIRPVLLALGLLLILSTPAAMGQSTLTIHEHFIDEPLSEVLQLLQDKYDVQLAYAHAAVEGIVINEKIDGLTLDGTLKQIFSNCDLSFQVVGHNQVLIRQVQNYSLPPEQDNTNWLTIRGKIQDQTSDGPLMYATVFVPGTNQHTLSDEEGDFALKVPFQDGLALLEIRYLGYETRILQLTAGQIADPLAVKLNLTPLEMPAVLVKVKPPALLNERSTGALNFQPAYLPDLPDFAAGQDLFRNLQMLPGIAAHDDLSADLRVRGGQSDENIVILDGIPLYHVDHFFGVFSSINSGLVEKVQIYKNAFPAQYGGRTSSVVDIVTKTVNGAEPGGSLDFNLLSSSARLEWPLGKKSSLLLGGRLTNQNLGLNELFGLLEQQSRTPIASELPQENVERAPLLAYEPGFNFYDLNAKWRLELQPNTTIQASYFRSRDHFTYDYSLEFISKIRKIRILNAEIFKEKAIWQNEGLNLSLNHQWDNGLTSRLNVSRSHYDIDNDISTKLLRTNLVKDTMIAIEEQRYNAIDAWDLHFKNEWAIKDQGKANAGYHLTQNETNFEVQADRNRAFHRVDQARQHSFFGEYQGWAVDEKLQFTAGFRATYYSLTQNWYASPRLSLSYQLNDQWRAKAAWSRYHQFLRRDYHADRFGRSFEFWILANGKKLFPVSSARNLMVGFHHVNELFSLDIEAYQKHTDGIVDHAVINLGLNDTGVGPVRNPRYVNFIGAGQTRGIDVLLKKAMEHYTGWLSYTLSKSTNTFPHFNQGQAFPSQEDRRHQLQCVNQWAYKRWSFSASYVFASGRPYTDLTTLIAISLERDQLRIKDHLDYLEDYHRVDIGVNYQFPIAKTTAKAGFSVFNLFDRHNVAYRQYFFNLQSSADHTADVKRGVFGNEVQMLGRTPNLSLSIEF